MKQLAVPLAAFIMLLNTNLGLAQVNCTSILKDAKRYYSKGNLREALITLQFVENCDYDDKLLKERQVLQTQIFDAIEKQRMESESLLQAIQKANQETQEANEYKVRFFLEEAEQEISASRYPEALGKINSAELLGVLNDSISLARKKLGEAISKDAKIKIGRGQFQEGVDLLFLLKGMVESQDLVKSGLSDLRVKLLPQIKENMANAYYYDIIDKLEIAVKAETPPDSLLAICQEVIFVHGEIGSFKVVDTIVRDFILMMMDADSTVIATLLGQINESSSFFRSNKASREIVETIDSTRFKFLCERYYPIELIKVEGGTFSLGDQFGEGEKDELPHRVTLDNFALGANEVSFYEYNLYCLFNGIPLPTDENWGKGSRPVINVSWFDAIRYCNWLSSQLGFEKVYKISTDTFNQTQVSIIDFSNGFRLPTEAEWEYAARSRGKEMRFAWGNDEIHGNIPDESLNKESRYSNWEIFQDYTDGYPHTAPTNLFQQGELGFFDLTGNVWEWCWDRYGEFYYEASINSRNPMGPDIGDHRILRGGSWGYIPYSCRISFRNGIYPERRSNSFGFRVALSNNQAPRF